MLDQPPAGATIAALSRSLTETKTVPVQRQADAGAELRLGEGAAEIAVDAHDLAGRFHLRPEDDVDAGEAGEREHRLLDRDVVAGARLVSSEVARASRRP